MTACGYGLKLNIAVSYIYNLFTKECCLKSKCSFIITAVLIVSIRICAQTHPNSPVYKDYKPVDSLSIFRKVDDSFKLWQGYLLLKEANAGNPLAEHELGIRYLTGRGFPADTAKSFLWIKKAADKKLPPANYNLALLLNNGWGTEWNPYEAYKRFDAAASDSMPEALFALGLLHTNNLTVPRNYKKAYESIKASADMGFKPAQEILTEFHKIGYGTKEEIKKASEDLILDYYQEESGITYFDLHSDSSKHIDDFTLLRDLIREEGEHFAGNIGIKSLSDSTLKADSSIIKTITATAESGSPEALSLLGRCYEKGTGVKKDRIRAAVHYLRALRLDSQNGSRLLWSLLQDNTFFDDLNRRIKLNDADAQFVLAVLTALKLSNIISDKEAFSLLEKAAEKNYVPAVIELGLCYYSGIFVNQDKEKGIAVWQTASDNGNSEARVRIAIAHIQDKSYGGNLRADLLVLNEAAEEGSLIAVMALAHCYLNGTGVEKNKAQAVNLYRKSAQRGSRGAHSALKRIYDEIRPADNEFLVLDENED